MRTNSATDSIENDGIDTFVRPRHRAEIVEQANARGFWMESRYGVSIRGTASGSATTIFPTVRGITGQGFPVEAEISWDLLQRLADGETDRVLV